MVLLGVQNGLKTGVLWNILRNVGEFILLDYKPYKKSVYLKLFYDPTNSLNYVSQLLEHNQVVNLEILSDKPTKLKNLRRECSNWAQLNVDLKILSSFDFITGAFILKLKSSEFCSVKKKMYDYTSVAIRINFVRKSVGDSICCCCRFFVGTKIYPKHPQRYVLLPVLAIGIK